LRATSALVGNLAKASRAAPACSRIGVRTAFIGERRRAGIAHQSTSTAGDEGIGDQPQEQVHGVEGRLLRSGGKLARDLGEAGGRQRSEGHRNGAVLLKKLVSVLATFCWLMLRPLPKFSARFR